MSIWIDGFVIYAFKKNGHVLELHTLLEFFTLLKIHILTFSIINKSVVYYTKF